MSDSKNISDEESTMVITLLRISILVLLLAAIVTIAIDHGIGVALVDCLVSISVLCGLEFIFSSTGSDLTGWAKFLSERNQATSKSLRYMSRSEKASSLCIVIFAFLTAVGIGLIFYLPCIWLFKNVPWSWRDEDGDRINGVAMMIAFFLTTYFIETVLKRTRR